MGDTVGIRELRQHLSRYLLRVEAGEVLRVTDRGRAVAILAPLPEDTSPAERLVAAGKARPPRLDLARLSPPLVTRTRYPASEALAEERSERD